MIGTDGDEMGANQPIRGEAADKEGGEQKPEVTLARGRQQGRYGCAQRVPVRMPERLMVRFRPMRYQPTISRVFGQEKGHRRHQYQGNCGNCHDRCLPPEMMGKCYKIRQEQQ